MKNRIKVDLEELIERLQTIADDGYATVELELYESEFYYGDGELIIAAVELGEDINTPYGTIVGVNYDIDEVTYEDFRDHGEEQ